MTQQLHFIEQATGCELAFPQGAVRPEEVYAGNILTIRNESGKQRFQVMDVEGFPEQPAQLAPVKSTLLKSTLLLGILGVSWFAIDWLFKLVF